MFSNLQIDMAKSVLKSCRAKGLRLSTAESCTGGLISGCLTEVSGSSEVLERGFITYSNQAKCDLLGVDLKMIEIAGAVSEEVARAMAEGALQRSEAHLSIAVTGIAGPGGGTKEKPIGLVHIAFAGEGIKTLHEKHIFDGDRKAVRSLTVLNSLKLILSQID